MTLSGILVVDKPSGMTSHDVVARMRRIFGTRKVGHAGTLDPLATGVLVVGLNDATRMLGYLTLATKSYQAVIRLGASSTTDDSQGELSAAIDTALLTDNLIVQSLDKQVGTIEQIPSSVSAVRVNGRRAHEMVRAGETVDLPARTVEVLSIEVHQITREDLFTDVHISVECSSGTFVRAIARDLGNDLGVGGHLISLRRTTSGPFNLDQAVTLTNLEESGQPWDRVLSMGEAAQMVWPCVTVDSEVRQRISKGQRIASSELPEGDTLALLDADRALLALISNSESGMAYRAVFIGNS